MSHSDAFRSFGSGPKKENSNEMNGTEYVPPLLIALGAIREVVLGNSASGNGDANSQYYW
ncbi:hypothetical protein [Lentzea jiangxiensis]|uniref:Uncharacterized protein n=1 Tax=Lentzea jiangxiensis TaxID=641025 RepID=A0A1H0SE94_9PSEU|nr:hypothetical protein [Lentzea jiangxiensis]SDP40122.1 hypothetical protein SAMN05421507_10828 [Lentzea jiangxiensis]